MSRHLLTSCFLLLTIVVVTCAAFRWKPCQYGAGCFCPYGEAGKCIHGECHCQDKFALLHHHESGISPLWHFHSRASRHKVCEFNIDCVKYCKSREAICYKDHHCHCYYKYINKYIP